MTADHCAAGSLRSKSSSSSTGEKSYLMFFKMVSCEALKPHVSEEVPIGAAPLSTNSINQLDTCFPPHVHLLEPLKQLE